MGSQTRLPGITALDHTADVGIDLEAPTLEELFLRAAAGMMWLLRGEDVPGGAAAVDGVDDGRSAQVSRRVSERVSPTGAASPHRGETRVLSASADDLPALLREWLRELLFWYEVDGLAFDKARFDELSNTGLVAEVEVVADPVEPIREIKGVTLHGLRAERRGEGWVGRVIFDV